MPDNAQSEKPAFMEKAVLWDKGNKISDFEVGKEFTHHWGRTLFSGDCTLYASLTQMYNPLYLNEEYAKAHGHPTIVVAPLLVFNTIVGLSVEDLSIRGPFVSIKDVAYHRSVYAGDTLCASSECLSKRMSESRPGNAIVTWRTEGFNQRDELVISYVRSNLLLE
ncbi:MAG: MaoC family dehydratase [Pseudomonadota bacterium]